MYRCAVWQKGTEGFEEPAFSIIRAVEMFSSMKMGEAGFHYMLFNSGI
jgi:hypothetical protein